MLDFIINQKHVNMKKLFLMTVVISGLFITSCNSGEKTADGNTTTSSDSLDSKKVAEDRNDKKFEDSTIENDSKFAVKAADGGMMEVELSKLALTKSTSPEIKKYAKMMVDDHTAANNELKKLAGSKNISVPAAVSTNKQEKLTDFMKKTGNDFDKDYISYMVSDHKDVVDLFKKQAEKGKDAELKAWAASKLSTLEHHLQMAQSTEDLVKNKKK